MRHKVLFLFITSLIYFGQCHIDINIKINIAIDIIKRKQAPYSVVENLCWGPEPTVKFYKTLIKNEIKYVSYTQNSNESLTRLKHQFTVVAELSCNLESLIEKARLEGYLGIPNVWIVFGLSGIQKLTYYIPVNCLLLVPVENESGIVVKSPYKTHPRFDGYVENILGRWTSNKSFLEFNDIMQKNRSNLLGMPLRVSYVVGNRETFKHMTDYRQKHINNVTKINYILFQIFCDLLNTTHYQIIRSVWGFKSRQPDDTFTKGLLGDVIYGRADISGTICFTPTYRLKYFKFMFAPVNNFKVFMVFKAPSLSSYTNLYRLPFDNLLWVCIGGFTVICGIIVGLVFGWEDREKYYRKQTEKNNENHPKFLDIIMMQIAIICQMDFFYEPKSVSGKLITFITLIFSTFIYTAYSARIVLLLQAKTNSITNVGLLYNAKFDFGVEDQSYNRYYFMNPADQTDEHWRKIIYENKIKRAKGDNFLSAVDGIRLVRDSHFAFHVELNVANYLVREMFKNEDICAVRKVKSIYNNEAPHIVSHKRSPYNELLLHSYRRLMEAGVHNREHRKLFAKLPACIGRGNIFVSVGFKESYFPLVVYIGCVFTSLFILILERASARYFNNNNISF